MEKDKYSLLKERIVKRTGIETITITIEAFSLIVDDYSIPECLVHVGNYYGAMAVYEGDNSKVGIREQDLIDFNILQPIKNNDIYETYPVVSPYGVPVVAEMNGDNKSWIFSIPESRWIHPGLADSTIESLNKEHVEFYSNYTISNTDTIMEIDKECKDKGLYKTDTILDEKDGSKYYLSGPATDIENHNIKNDEKLAIDINLNINATYGAKHSSEFPKDVKTSKTNDIEGLVNKRRMAKININCNIPLYTPNDIPMFDPTATENLTKMCRTFNNSFKMGIADKIMETLKPKKEILKIFNKLIEQFKNITKKDFKRLRTYVISGKDDYYHIKYGNELNMMLHYLKLNLPIGTTLIHLDNLIVDIRRIILEGKPTIKFNLNIEEFNLFKKWLLDNSERIEDGN